jgi:hypothetical protein
MIRSTAPACVCHTGTHTRVCFVHTQEGVPEAIESLLAAGVGVWVLTGDKVTRSAVGCRLSVLDCRALLGAACCCAWAAAMCRVLFWRG